MKLLRKHTYLSALLAGLVVLILFFPAPAHANWIGSLFGLSDIGSYVIGFIVYVISYVVTFVAGIIIQIESFVVGFLLSINSGITNSPPVQVGFSVVLSIANLCFVLVLIVIGIATILRSQQYGLKQALLKLVAAAILVNFSLVIAGAILQFSDGLSIYFVKSISPEENNDGFGGFASAIAGAFNPQKEFMTGVSSSTRNSPGDVSDTFGSDIAKMLVPITALLFVVFTLTIIIITLGTLVVMLIVRYVVIGILLILMPMAWVCWIFPLFSNQWHKWWNKFLQWTFFAPIVIFFLWIGVQSAYIMNAGNTTSYNPQTYREGQGKGPWDALGENLKDLVTPLITNMLNIFVLSGIMVGGIFAAQELSITGAAGGMAAIKKSGAWMQGYAGRKTRQAIGRPARPLSDRLNNWAARNPRLARYTGAGIVARGLAKTATGGGENLVKEFEKKHAGKEIRELKAALISARGPEKVAIEKLLGQKDEINTSSTINGKNKKLHERFGQKKQFEELEKKRGINAETNDALNVGDWDGARQAFEQFIGTFKRGEASKILANDLFDPNLQRRAEKMNMSTEAMKQFMPIFTDTLATRAPNLTPNLISQMKTEQLNEFQTRYDVSITGIADPIQQKNVRERFNTLLANQALFAGYEGGGGTEQTQTQTQAPVPPPQRT